MKKIVKKKVLLNPEAEAAKYLREIPDDPQKLVDLERIAQEDDKRLRPHIKGETKIEP